VISLKEESSAVQSLKDEFTQRIADAERKAQLACKERDIAKKVIHSPSTPSELHGGSSPKLQKALFGSTTNPFVL